MNLGHRAASAAPADTWLDTLARACGRRLPRRRALGLLAAALAAGTLGPAARTDAAAKAKRRSKARHGAAGPAVKGRAGGLVSAPSKDRVCAAQGRTNCGGLCTDTRDDSANCGACGHSCPLGGYCRAGACMGLVCLDGLTACRGRCVDLSSDWGHCGGCDLGCFAGYACVDGQCVA